MFQLKIVDVKISLKFGKGFNFYKLENLASSIFK